MPEVFRLDGFRFHFFANEGSPLEPPHVHVAKRPGDCKFWLHPQVRLAYSKGFDERTLRKVKQIVEVRKPEIEDAWNDFFFGR